VAVVKNIEEGIINVNYKATVEVLVKVYVTDALSTMLRLLKEESEEASWLIQARSRIDPVELYNEEW